jgi:hypothetical protein
MQREYRIPTSLSYLTNTDRTILDSRDSSPIQHFSLTSLSSCTPALTAVECNVCKKQMSFKKRRQLIKLQLFRSGRPMISTPQSHRILRSFGQAATVRLLTDIPKGGLADVC